MTGDFVFHEMNRLQVRQLIELAIREGWNPGLHDADTFWKIDQHGFLAVEHQGKVVGGGSVVRHNHSFGFMGLFIIDSEFRGQGIGSRLWFERRTRLLNRLEPGATIGLDAVESMIPFYERGGFKTAFRHVRYRWDNETPTVDARSCLVELDSFPIEDILRFDRDCFPGPRESFWRSWIAQPGAHKVAALKGDRLRGYGVIRPCQQGWKIGPLLARDQATALKIFKRLVTLGTPGPVFLDVPEINQLALDMCDRLGMKSGCHCTRMYYGTPPQVEDDFVFGAATMELG